MDGGGGGPGSPPWLRSARGAPSPKRHTPRLRGRSCSPVAKALEARVGTPNLVPVVLGGVRGRRSQAQLQASKVYGPEGTPDASSWWDSRPTPPSPRSRSPRSPELYHAEIRTCDAAELRPVLGGRAGRAER